MKAKDITDLLHNPQPEYIELINRAFDFAQKVHEGQLRKSGEPYFIHPYNVALILADFRADPETIAAGLLHDTIEDGNITKKDLETNFGKDIAFLVEGVTKLGKLKYQGVERHVESLRKLFVAMAEDVRVIIIRLADRLHNVRTLQYVRPDKQRRIALETLEIYAPLANRLGIWRLKGMLEDASFPYAQPEEYKKVLVLRKTKGKETLKRLEKIYRTLSKELAKRGFKDFAIDYRIKYLYSLYAKLLRNNMDIEKIYDISALRVIVDTAEQCYQVLGIVHSLWRPIPDRLRDYIANPKPNGYQSIHTAVTLDDGPIIEIQIRTKQMQYEAEYGIASHILYDESDKPKEGGKLTKSLNWIKELIDWQKHVNESEEFLKGIKTDFFQDRIFVYTPKNDVIELPKGSTPIDFAYVIHSDIGDHAHGAVINGKFASLDTELKNGDVVSIETNKNSKPTAKWLGFAHTIGAKKHIRQALGMVSPLKPKKIDLN